MDYLFHEDYSYYEAKNLYVSFEKHMSMSHKLEKKLGGLRKGDHKAKKAVSAKLETIWIGRMNVRGL